MGWEGAKGEGEIINLALFGQDRDGKQGEIFYFVWIKREEKGGK